MLFDRDRRTPPALAIALLCTPCIAQDVQLDFAIQGASLRSFYEPRAKELELEVRDRLLTSCKDDRHLCFWMMVPPSTDEAERKARPSFNVALLVKDDVLRVQLEVQSAFLGDLSGLTTRFSERLVPPAELLRITTAGAPPRNQLAALVERALQNLIKNNLDPLFECVRNGCPLGRFRHVFPPSMDQAGQRFEMVLPIDFNDARNCFLLTSSFELKCATDRNVDTRLDLRGTGLAAEYPPLQAVPPEERITGVKVELEHLRFGTGAAEPLKAALHSELMQSVKPTFYFLRELNEGALQCADSRVSVVQ